MIINIRVDEGTLAAPVEDGVRVGMEFDWSAFSPIPESVHIDTEAGTAELIYEDKDAYPNEVVSDLAPLRAILQAFDAQREGEIDGINADFDNMMAEDFRRMEYPTTDELIIADWKDRNDGGNALEIDRLKSARAAVKTAYPDGTSNQELRGSWKARNGLTRFDAKTHPAKLAAMIGG